MWASTRSVGHYYGSLPGVWVITDCDRGSLPGVWVITDCDCGPLPGVWVITDCVGRYLECGSLLTCIVGRYLECGSLGVVRRLRMGWGWGSRYAGWLIVWSVSRVIVSEHGSPF